MKGKIMPRVNTVKIGPPRAPKIEKAIRRTPAGTIWRRNASPMMRRPRRTAKRRYKGVPTRKVLEQSWGLGYCHVLNSGGRRSEKAGLLKNVYRRLDNHSASYIRMYWLHVILSLCFESSGSYTYLQFTVINLYCYNPPLRHESFYT